MHYFIILKQLIIEFINAIKDNKPIDFPGVIYKKDGEIINTGVRVQSENIDTIPNMHFLHTERLLKKNYRNSIMANSYKKRIKK